MHQRKERLFGELLQRTVCLSVCLCRCLNRPVVLRQRRSDILLPFPCACVLDLSLHDRQCPPDALGLLSEVARLGPVCAAVLALGHGPPHAFAFLLDLLVEVCQFRG